MVSTPQREPAPIEHDPLAERFREMWAEHDWLIAEGIDPDEEVDRIAEELFGSPEATAVLIDYLRATYEGRRTGWLDRHCDEDDASS